MIPEKQPLDIATQQFFYKPMCSLLYSFALRAYGNTGCRLESPVLDLGCSDGTFGTMLTQMLGQSKLLIGTDIDVAVLNKAKMKNFKPYSMFIQSNAAGLPFVDGSFSTVFSNHVFQSIDDLPAVIKEIKRVLASDGQFYCTIQTNLFREYYPIGRLLRCIGLKRLAEKYLQGIDRRLRQINVSFSPTKWINIFAEEGLRVNKVEGYYPLRLMPLWSLLILTPMRIFGLLKLIPLKSVHRMSAHLQRLVFTETFLHSLNDKNPEDCEHILICASK